MSESNHAPKSRTAWYCVKTQPKRETVAASQIEARGVEVFAPRIRFQRRTPRGKVWFDESLFPGYIFARFDLQENIRAVSSAYGVRGLVRFAGECAEVPGAMIEMLRNEAQETIVISGPELKEGDEAVVAEGAMLGLRAVITKVLPGKDRVRILMDMMGTAIEAEVPVAALEKAD